MAKPKASKPRKGLSSLRVKCPELYPAEKPKRRRIVRSDPAFDKAMAEQFDKYAEEAMAENRGE